MMIIVTILGEGRETSRSSISSLAAGVAVFYRVPRRQGAVPPSRPVRIIVGFRRRHHRHRRTPDCSGAVVDSANNLHRESTRRCHQFYD
jgi:hypothetical protein